jgi:lipooligosaccharide transport system permease protein
MSVLTLSRVVPAPPLGRMPSLRVIERNLIVYRRVWYVFLSGLAEPLFYLLSLGVGLGVLVGRVAGPGGGLIGYRDFVAPALLASSATNGAIYDSTFNVFWHIKYGKTFSAMLATSMSVEDVALGQILWAQLRGLLYAAAFVLVMLAMGLVHSWWAVLLLPTAALIGFAFAALGFACTTYMRSWQDFEYVVLAIMPMFLFSTTFYPLDVYPRAVQLVIECTPMYQGIVLMRDLTFGAVNAGLLIPVAYLTVMGLAGAVVASRRLGTLMTT